MLQNQGLMVEEQALGMMGFFSTNPNSNSLAPFLPNDHHDHINTHQFGSNDSHAHQESLKYAFVASSMLPSLINRGGAKGGDDDDEHDDDHHHHHHHHGASSNNSSGGLCEALLMSCAHNPKSRDLLLHQDPSSFMGVSTTTTTAHGLLSLHQSSNPSNPWEWGSSERESMGSKSLFDGDNESVEEDYQDNNNSNGMVNINMNKIKNDMLGVSGLRMKKTKVVRRKVREPRFSFKTLSDVDVLDDGYKWRKYGQKVVKNTQHPRSYYRCTQEKCRVKKKVERLAEDPRMVITTYEGRHVHSPSHDNLNDDSSSAATHPFLNNFFC